MVLPVLGSIVSSSDANDRFIKAMDELQHFVSNTYKNTLKHKSIES